MNLETRYRRLLALYPPAHRDLYEEEMLAVLLADAAPDQRRPGRAATFDLVVSAMRERVRYAGTAITGTRWRDAAALVGTFLPILLLLKVARFPIAELVFALRTGGAVPPVATSHAVILIGWSLVSLLAIAGWRRVAAIWAAVCLVAQIVQLSGVYFDDPATVLYATWSVVVGVIAVACLSYGRSGAPLRQTLRVPARVAIAVGIGLTALWPATDNLLGRVHTEDGWTSIEISDDNYGLAFLGRSFGAQTVATTAVLFMIAIVLVTVLALLTGPIRRRVVALAVPIVAMYTMIVTTFDGYFTSALRFDPPVLLVSGQWVALVGVPVASFLIAALLVHRRERTLELVALGRAARRANPGASHLTDAEQSAP